VNLRQFDFNLPKALIAQYPLLERDQSRMMVVHRDEQRWEHRMFFELPELLDPRDCLILNNTRVIPARLRARRAGQNESIEVLLVREEAPGDWQALLKPARKTPVGQLLEIAGRSARVLEVKSDGSRMIRFIPPEGLMELLETEGEPPLPPYIERRVGEDLSQDRVRYQTVYASRIGSIAAPTAGLHFTPKVLRRLELRGVRCLEILLHVGRGTFQPVRCEKIENHRLDPEFFEISAEAAADILRWKSEGRRLVAVGTTTTRVLEYWALKRHESRRGASGYCDLFIYPGFGFRMLDGLLTNFHLPKSTLFMLVCAFAGTQFMLDCYHEAMRAGYRFFSYGDCMLIR
jgi:S-adenosylmethionine:tRNA ribosyltransferase-isomerase